MSPCAQIRQFVTSVERFVNDLIWLLSRPDFTAAAMHLDPPDHWFEPVDIVDRIDELVNEQIEHGKADQR